MQKPEDNHKKIKKNGKRSTQGIRENAKNKNIKGMKIEKTWKRKLKIKKIKQNKKRRKWMKIIKKNRIENIKIKTAYWMKKYKIWITKAYTGKN